MLDQQTVGATSLNAFKNGLDKLKKTKMGFLWIDPLSTRPLVGMDCPAGEAIHVELRGELPWILKSYSSNNSEIRPRCSVVKTKLLQND